MKKKLMVQVRNGCDLIWCYGFDEDFSNQAGGITSASYYVDGTINDIRAALQLALDQLDFSMMPINLQEEDFPLELDAMEKYLSEIKGEVERFVLEESACQK